MRQSAIVVSLLLVASVAQARNTDLVLPVAAAVQSEVGKERLLQVPFYFVGQQHPAVAEELSVARSNRSTRGAFRSDETSCQIALLSVLRELQARAQEVGADAIIDIKSVTKNQPLESATEYRCVAGAMVVHVGLEGKLVKLKK